nr:Dihydroneopterin aldolase [uncultured bacterium]AIA13899.1 Dihydroneopterin aldolase [uncultured bacterium]AIA14248.1 Dihydroneopterin aldolase [uncultured bacterium]
MDYIHIDKLVLRGKHGHYERERRVEQEFEVWVKLGIETATAGASDKLPDTLDYDEVKTIIQTVVDGSSRYLIEKLAEDMAHKILEDKRVMSIELTIKKPEVWDNGVPGITVVRTQS